MIFYYYFSADFYLQGGGGRSKGPLNTLLTPPIATPSILPNAAVTDRVEMRFFADRPL